MAYISFDWCRECRCDTQHLNRNCVQCADRKAREQQAIWNSKTPDEKIEALLRRIEALENKNQKYA